SRTVYVRLTVNASAPNNSSITDKASATSSTADPNGTNNTDIADTDTVATSATLAVTKNDGTATMDAGSRTTYTITVTNKGPSYAQPVNFSDTLPASNVSYPKACVVTGSVDCSFFSQCSADTRDIHSFPARRSSDLSRTVYVRLTVNASAPNNSS